MSFILNSETTKILIDLNAFADTTFIYGGFANKIQNNYEFSNFDMLTLKKDNTIEVLPDY